MSLSRATKALLSLCPLMFSTMAIGQKAENTGGLSSPILASYDFELATPSGPDTFWLRDGAGGKVDLSTAFRVSGERSLHLREQAGNRDFAEFLGYFDERTTGAVFVQFYLLLADPDQRFNFGLAGPEWFLSKARHGHAVWLDTQDGSFGHRPGDRWQAIFDPLPFVWYFVDLVYHIESGTYDLAIYEENCGIGCDEPITDLRAQRNFADIDSSSVRYFSFIGDLEDEGRFDYFVDDLLVATDPELRQLPFVAPGRRRFFVDRMRVGQPALSTAERDDLLFAARQWLRDRNPADTKQAMSLDRLEQAADEAFTLGQLKLAEELYCRLAEDPNREIRVQLKRADVAHRMGDAEAERALREAIYGQLKPEE